ncbi:MAG: lysozyme inhibitor LprI family protein [Pseudomonas sp.]|nr:lysozyme inhibitor LprI family protein [Pseudomonas sp.]
MQFRRNWPIAIIATALSAAANAADDGYSTTYTTCMDQSGGVTANILNCIADEIEQQDARLNQHYKSAMRALSQEQQPQLRDVQRLWISFRDADCALLGNLTGGSIDAINRSSCYLDMTKKRAGDLAWLAEQGQ